MKFCLPECRQKNVGKIHQNNTEINQFLGWNEQLNALRFFVEFEVR